MPRGHEQHFVCIFERFSGHFFLKFSQNKIVMGKKILVQCFDVIMIAFSLKFIRLLRVVFSSQQRLNRQAVNAVQ